MFHCRLRFHRGRDRWEPVGTAMPPAIVTASVRGWPIRVNALGAMGPGSAIYVTAQEDRDSEGGRTNCSSRPATRLRLVVLQRPSRVSRLLPAIR